MNWSLIEIRNWLNTKEVLKKKEKPTSRSYKRLSKSAKSLKTKEAQWCLNSRKREPNGVWIETILFLRSRKSKNRLTNFREDKKLFWERMRSWKMKEELENNLHMAKELLDKEVLEVSTPHQCLDKLWWRTWLKRKIQLARCLLLEHSKNTLEELEVMEIQKNLKMWWNWVLQMPQEHSWTTREMSLQGLTVLSLWPTFRRISLQMTQEATTDNSNLPYEF